MKKYRMFAVALLSFIALDLGLLIALTWFAIHDKSDENYKIEEPRYFLIYVSISVAIAGLLFVL
jgi:hypothetical protein